MGPRVLARRDGRTCPAADQPPDSDSRAPAERRAQRLRPRAAGHAIVTGRRITGCRRSAFPRGPRPARARRRGGRRARRAAGSAVRTTAAPRSPCPSHVTASIRHREAPLRVSEAPPSPRAFVPAAMSPAARHVGERATLLWTPSSSTTNASKHERRPRADHRIWQTGPRRIAVEPVRPRSTSGRCFARSVGASAWDDTRVPWCRRGSGRDRRLGGRRRALFPSRRRHDEHADEQQGRSAARAAPRSVPARTRMAARCPRPSRRRQPHRDRRCPAPAARRSSVSARAGRRARAPRRRSRPGHRLGRAAGDKPMTAAPITAVRAIASIPRPIADVGIRRRRVRSGRDPVQTETSRCPGSEYAQVRSANARFRSNDCSRAHLSAAGRGAAVSYVQVSPVQPSMS